MGNIRDEMAKIIKDWEENRYIHLQSKEENQVQNTQQQSQHVSSITGNPFGTRGPGTFSHAVLEYVKQNPGLNGIQIREAMLAKFPTQRLSQTASTLKQLTDHFYVIRTETRVHHQRSFVYTARSEAEQKLLFMKAKINKKKLRANAAKAREVMAAKRAAAKAEEAKATEVMNTPVVPIQSTWVQLPLTPTPHVPSPQAAMVVTNEAPVQEKKETSTVSIRLTLTIAGQDVKVTVKEAMQLHRQLAEFLGV
jgi:hypothetical protein